MRKLILLLLAVVLIPATASCLPGLTKWKLVWDANVEPDLAGYKVYWSITSGAYTDVDSVDVGNVTEEPLELLPLTDGTTYYFVVTAYDTSSNESDFSNEVSQLYDQTAPAAGKLQLERVVQ